MIHFDPLLFHELMNSRPSLEPPAGLPLKEEREALHKVAHSLEKPLALRVDLAQPLRLDPSTALTPDTLEARNEETSRVREEREKLTSESFAQNSRMQGVQADAVRKDRAHSALEQTGPAQTAAPEITLNVDLNVEPDVEGVVVQKDGSSVQSFSVPSEFLGVLADFKPGLTLEGTYSSEKLAELRAQCESLVDRLAAQPDFAAAPVLKAALEKLGQVLNAQASRAQLEEVQGQLSLLCADSGLSPEEKLADMGTRFHAVWLRAQVQTKALADMAQGRPDPRAASVLNGGIGIAGEDAAALERSLLDAMSAELQKMADSRLTGQACRDLALLALRGQFDAGAMLKLILSAPQWAGSDEHFSDLVSALAQGVADTLAAPAAPAGEPPAPSGPAEGGPDGPDLARRLAYVDMLFQGSYPESSDAALDLKKMLLPGHQREAELQHMLKMTSRQLFVDILDPDMGGTGRSGALRRTAGSVSLRSIVLQADNVRLLQSKVGIKDFDFHLAHVAVLQKLCANAHLLEVDRATTLAMSDMKGWCRSLGLSARAAEYAGSLDLSILEGGENGDTYTRRMLGACAEFVRGLRGTTQRDAAGKIVLDVSSLTDSPLARRRERQLYETSPDYLARLALDRQVVSLSGLLKENQRFTADMDVDGAAVDEAIRTANTRFLQSVAEKTAAGRSLVENADEGRLLQLADERLEIRRQLLREAAKLNSRHAQVRALADSLGEKLELEAARDTLAQERAQMEGDRAKVRFSWLHQRRDRHRVCDVVLDIARLAAERDALPEGSDRAAVENSIARALDELKGVDAFSLTHRAKAGGDAPSLETVLEHMLPRARALDYFRIHRRGGMPASEATLAALKMKGLSLKLSRLKMEVDARSLRYFALLGRKDMRRLQDTVAAAVLKVYVESGADMASFSLRDAPTQEALLGQLSRWGMDMERPFLRTVAMLAAARMTKGTGRLDVSVLRDMADDSKVRFAGRESLDAMRQELREQGRSALGARHAVHSFAKHGILTEKRVREGGVRSLMRMASRPGGGFVLDRTGGLVMDTGSVFSPISMQNGLVTVTSLKHLLSLKFQRLHSNSLTVTNVGGGSYQVILKGKDITSLGAKMKLPAGPVVGFVEGGVGGEGEKGLALTFPSQESCEAFLKDFMNKDTDLHGYQDAASQSWRNAVDVRFVSGTQVSANIAGGVMGTLLSAKLSEVDTAALSAVASVRFSGEVSLKNERNAHGETVVLSRKGAVMLAAGASVGLTHEKKLFGSPALSTGTGAAMDIDQRFKVVTTDKGLSAATCVETEFGRGTLSAHGLRHLMLPAALTDAIKKDVAFADALDDVLNGLPPTARLVLQRKIKPEVLAQARQLMVEARHAPTEKDAKAKLDAAHDLLTRFDSYTPHKLVVKSAGQTMLGRGWSPGFSFLQVSRRATLTSFGAKASLEIALPEIGA